MCLSIFLSTSASQPAQAQKENAPLITTKCFETFISNRTGGEETGKRLRGATLPPADHRNQNASKPGRKSILPAGFSGRGLNGGCPWGPEKEREPLEGARANHPWTARVPLDPPTEPQRGGQEVRTSRKIRSCWGLVLGLPRGALRSVPVSQPASAGRFLPETA